MPRESAGLLMYRGGPKALEVLLVRPGGPFTKKKKQAVWTIPKGEIEAGEDPLTTACREFKEETNFDPHPPYLELGQIRQKGGKIVQAWAFAGEADLTQFCCNTFRMEWPPNSGTFQDFPEMEEARFFSIAEARNYLKETQHPFLDRLVETVDHPARRA